MKRPMLAVILGCAVLSACSRGEGLHTGSPGPRHARVTAAGRLRPAAGTREAAVTVALPDALPIDPAFEELLLLPADTPSAVAYRFELEAGERLDITVAAEAAAPVAVVDVFEHLGGTAYRHALAGRSGEPFSFEPPAAGRYVLRVRSESASGRYRVRVHTPPAAVLFPVAGADATAIRSSYGDARSEGERSHEGVDIFAPRGTPVLAVAPAIVERVETTRAGGRVVWARDTIRELTYYYAHLETQRVARGARVAAGDTIGTVGNSGNASGSSPHLHFGIYRPGTIPVNPLPLLGRGTGALLVAADSAAVVLGSRAQTRGSAVRLRVSPTANAAIVAQLPARTALRITGIIGEWRRVVLEDGRCGFVAGWLLQPAGEVAQ